MSNAVPRVVVDASADQATQKAVEDMNRVIRALIARIEALEARIVALGG